MQLISPCSNGDSRSLLVDTCRGLRDERERMAAPKSLEPEETPVRVSGMTRSSVRRRMVERRVMGSVVAVVVAGTPEDVEVVDAIMKEVEDARGWVERKNG